MQKINKKYRVVNTLNNKPSTDEIQTASLNKSEKAKKHNLETKIVKPNRSNYENAYKSHVPSRESIQGKSGKFNYSLNQNKTSVYERKSSPVQKFEPNSDEKDYYESPKQSNESNDEYNALGKNSWNSEKEYHPQYTPIESESQR